MPKEPPRGGSYENPLKPFTEKDEEERPLTEAFDQGNLVNKHQGWAVSGLLALAGWSGPLGVFLRDCLSPFTEKDDEEERPLQRLLTKEIL